MEPVTTQITDLTDRWFWTSLRESFRFHVSLVAMASDRLFICIISASPSLPDLALSISSSSKSRPRLPSTVRIVTSSACVLVDGLGPL